MTYNLVYHSDVDKVDLPRIDKKNKSMIKRAIEDRLKTQPEIYAKPSQRTLKGYWKLRVGEFRAVFKIFGNELRIYGIIHRKRVGILKRDFGIFKSFSFESVIIHSIVYKCQYFSESYSILP